MHSKHYESKKIKMTYILERREYLCVVEANLTTAVTAVAISAARRLMRCRKHIGTFFFCETRIANQVETFVASATFVSCRTFVK